MLGTSILFEGAGYSEARTIAQKVGAVVDLKQLGTRSLWECNHQRDAVVVGGIAKLSFASVYYDGQGVWLELGGPSIPRSQSELSRLLGALGLHHVRSRGVHMRSDVTLAR